ncbi:MAG: cobalamin-dependent protein, partial [Leptospiraceae bacterium]|nr:cobalamin-dependent protein [Leptospiraceae bacterium]
MSYQTPPYKPKNKIRIVTAASLFDGHDASINIMRRILHSSGAEVIHLGHNRSAGEIVDCAIQEDVQAIALTSYQGGHLEYFKYIYDLLKQNNSSHIKIFGGGGGTILPSEMDELHSYGIEKIYSPDDGRKMGLQGMINDLLERSDFNISNLFEIKSQRNDIWLSRAITLAEEETHIPDTLIHKLVQKSSLPQIVIGITGTGGAGKSSYTDELVRNFIEIEPNLKIAVLSVDPTKKKTGGALLGDRIRMNSIYTPNVYMRSMATREENSSTSPYLLKSIDLCKKAGYNIIIIETAGIGQSDSRITEFCDFSIYVMTPEFGAQTQLEKIDMLDFADMVVINKFDRKGGLDAKRDVAKQIQRTNNLYDKPLDSMPVFGTISSQFNNKGVKESFQFIISILENKFHYKFNLHEEFLLNSRKEVQILPPERFGYLLEITNVSKDYSEFVKKESEVASKAYKLNGLINEQNFSSELIESLKSEFDKTYSLLSQESKEIISNWNDIINKYKSDTYTYKVREKNITVENYITSLSNSKIPKISLPTFNDWGDILRWSYTENVPGEFPFTAGVYPYKREGEDPIRMFAGEGGPERTNKRFHYLSKGQPAIRLSTAFDSVTLYGENPSQRPDIYGKIGNSGVSIASLDDAKRLYSGFDLCSPNTSVSMTINGPAPMLLAFFLNTAIDQQCEIYIKNNGLTAQVKQKIKDIYNSSSLPIYRGNTPEGNSGLGLMLLGVSGDQVLEKEVYEKIKIDTLGKVRGTVQADILKEDQAQNTCIFSTEFALKLMGDVQEYFIQNSVKNFYSVSVSGYHIAEAGANPITQLAFTLSNGFTLLEYYLSRGMKIDEFAPNFSFFFSNGMDPEYSVIGRVARRIWAKTIKFKYKGNKRSQLLKYHIQTSGRSLHAQEIAFNDIRTTLQALYAIYDNCNSLHTNAYDEAITTPTEESVRRAVAIQLIINRELGSVKSENFIQGSFAIEELTDLVEKAVYDEFKRLNDRGGVLGAMETMYQRNKIQEESLYYEHRKQTGAYPIIGVNTFLDEKGSPT